MTQRGRHLAPKLRRISRRWALPLSLAMLLVWSSVAWADQVVGDADALSTSSPSPNGVVAEQQPGTTVAYDLSAHIKETGADPKKVFQNPGDEVLVTITRSGAWADGGTPASFTFTQYNLNQAGTFRITVPCGTSENTSEVMTAVLAGTPETGELNPASVTLTYTISAKGADHSSCAPANTAPSVGFTSGPTAVNENSSVEHTYAFSITDPDVGDSWGFVSGYPTCGIGGELVAGSPDIDVATKSGSFRCTFDDGPASPTVAVKVQDAANTESDPATRSVSVSNIAPTASLNASPANTFTGMIVTYNASATDPSGADTTTGFTWSFDNGTTWTSSPTSTAQLQKTYSTCGVHTQSVRAQDKDSGVSAASSASSSVYDGGWHGAIKPAMRNMVQKGRVVPVQIRVNCDGVDVTGLSPTIQLLKGELDPETDPDAESVLTPTSVSAADNTGVMRPVDGGYIYNLQIPTNASVGQLYTIRVRPWGANGALLQAVVEIRK